MSDPIAIDADTVMGKRTLIVGEVNTGKTTITGRILAQVCRRIAAERLAVIDLAPTIPPQAAVGLGLKGVGGRLRLPEESQGLYLSTRIDPPRLSTDTEEAALEVARRNQKKIEKLLQTFSESGRDVLFVNDISLYLQAGKARDLLSRFDAVTTLVANGYLGERLGRGVLSQREHQEMLALADAFSAVIRL